MVFHNICQMLACIIKSQNNYLTWPQFRVLVTGSPCRFCGCAFLASSVRFLVILLPVSLYPPAAASNALFTTSLSHTQFSNLPTFHLSLFWTYLQCNLIINLLHALIESIEANRAVVWVDICSCLSLVEKSNDISFHLSFNSGVVFTTSPFLDFLYYCLWPPCQVCLPFLNVSTIVTFAFLLPISCMVGQCLQPLTLWFLAFVCFMPVLRYQCTIMIPLLSYR